MLGALRALRGCLAFGRSKADQYRRQYRSCHLLIHLHGVEKLVGVDLTKVHEVEIEVTQSDNPDKPPKSPAFRCAYSRDCI